MYRHPSETVIFAKFLRNLILGDKGRHLFSLLNAMVSTGHRVLFFDDKSETELGTYGLMARKLPGVELTTEVPEVVADMICLFDDEDDSIGRREWLKKIRVGFDIFSRYWLRNPVIMPFSLHPVHTGPELPRRLSRLRNSVPAMRVFFSGEVEGYTQSRIRYPRAKLPRAAIIDTIVQRMGGQTVYLREQAALDALLMGPYARKCIIADTRYARVQESEWLDVLASADFFLAPPGIVMPMCHNAVEAMAVGAIPITNYAEWFSPRLEHGRTCIAFDDERDLVGKMRLALDMTPDEVAEMRRRVAEYYDAHLSSKSFVGKLLSRPGRRDDLLMISGRYVAANADRLGRSSVLLRERPDGGLLARLRALGS
jgi:hypothetical protein